eukprot:TRINITY_DN1267_c0_g1_i12.p1 TRINITY_DN1267_c0_g1~~TRINITY_DN1267_c0_g1_i12.p1  ORF type:complete len:197 (-),score=99.90 TRINITY_DN1267_c0_g1_i12:297-854(-)
MLRSLVGSEMCIRDRYQRRVRGLNSSTMVKKRQVQISEDDMRQFKEAFELFDTDQSGTIDGSELKFCMQALGFDPSPYEIKEMLEKIDQDGNATVEFEEFVDLLSGKMDEKDPTTEMADAFAMFDKDNTGRITFKNMQDICREMGDKELADNEPEVQQIIDEINPAGWTMEDFLALMQRQGVYQG